MNFDTENVPEQFLQGHDFIMSDHQDAKVDGRTSYRPTYSCLTLGVLNDHNRGRDKMRQFFLFMFLSYIGTMASIQICMMKRVNKSKYLLTPTVKGKPCVKLSTKGLCIRKNCLKSWCRRNGTVWYVIGLQCKINVLRIYSYTMYASTRYVNNYCRTSDLI